MSNEDTIRRAIEAMNRHDSSAFVEMYAGDAVAYDPQYPEPLRGKDALRKDMQDFISAFPDLQMRLENLISSGGAVAFEVSAGGTHGGELVGSSGSIPATHKRLDMRVAVFATFNDQGQIVEEHRYYDLVGMMAQLGVSMPSAAT